MGEIKSTIELMMERTRDLRLSPEEKEAVRREEFLKRAKGLRLRILGGEDADAVIASMERDPPEDRALLNTLLWETFLEGLPPNDDALDHLEIMARLPKAHDKTRLFNKARAILKGALKEAGKERQKLLNKERKRLAAFGVSGTAVIPRPPAGARVSSAAQEGLREVRAVLR